MGVAVRQSTAFLAVLVTLLWMAVCAVSVAYYRLMCALHAKDPRGERHGRRRSSGGLQMTAAAPVSCDQQAPGRWAVPVRATGKGWDNVNSGSGNRRLVTRCVQWQPVSTLI